MMLRTWDPHAAHQRYMAGESAESIAVDYGVTRWAIWQSFKALGLERRAAGRQRTQACHCGLPPMENSSLCREHLRAVNNLASRNSHARRRMAPGLAQRAIRRPGEFTAPERELARHALGLPNSKNVSYRNRFMAGGHDRKMWCRMARNGLAETDFVPHVLQFFRLTREGALAALEPGERLSVEDFPED